jgi:hypothetical protein
MPNPTSSNVNPPARTHADAATLFRRPFAPGAIGFRAMTKVPYRGPMRERIDASPRRYQRLASLA